MASGALDALWTTLWVDGNAGPFTRRHNSAFVEPSEKRSDPPSLERLTAAGIPVVPKAEFEAAVYERRERRQLLRGFLESERRDWP